jgi:hypothetical protein
MLPASLPRSTIVLAIATCIPFGLAIRDTATGKYDFELDDDEALDRFGHDDDDDDEDEDEDEDYRDTAARLEAEDRLNRIAFAEFEAQREADRLQRSALVQSLYGAEVASMGSAFDKVILGARVGHSSVTSTSSVDLMLLDDGIATHTLFIKIEREADGATINASSICAGIDRSLRDAWGQHRSLNDRRIWINEPAAQRAVYDPETCELRYEKITTIDAWLSKAETSLVPMWAVGRPAKKLLEVLGERTSSTLEDDEITWAVRGLGAGTGPTQLVADVRAGKVVSVFASVETDFETQAAIADRVNELTGKQADDNGVWKSAPRISMETGSIQMFLTIGQRPE